MATSGRDGWGRGNGALSRSRGGRQLAVLASWTWWLDHACRPIVRSSLFPPYLLLTVNGCPSGPGASSPQVFLYRTTRKVKVDAGVTALIGI